MQLNDIIGICPECGDELMAHRTRSGKRVVMCLNSNCPKKFAYPLPSKGTIEATGVKCPISNVPVLAIIPNIAIRNRQSRKNEKKTYFWAQGPCFTCSKQAKCDALLDVQSEYLSIDDE